MCRFLSYHLHSSIQPSGRGIKARSAITFPHTISFAEPKSWHRKCPRGTPCWSENCEPRSRYPHLETECVNSAVCVCLSASQPGGVDSAEDPRLIHYTSPADPVFWAPAKNTANVVDLNSRLTKFRTNTSACRSVPSRQKLRRRKLKKKPKQNKKNPTPGGEHSYLRHHISTSTEKCQRLRGRHPSGSKKALQRKEVSYRVNTEYKTKQSQQARTLLCFSSGQTLFFLFYFFLWHLIPATQRRSAARLRSSNLYLALSASHIQYRRQFHTRKKENALLLYFLLPSWNNLQTILSADGGEKKKKKEDSDCFFFLCSKVANSSKVASIYKHVAFYCKVTTVRADEWLRMAVG